VISVAGRLIGTIMLSITGNVARNEQYFTLAVWWESARLFLSSPIITATSCWKF
jgi:hypothetical protein